MKTKETKETKKTTKAEKPQTKKSKFALAWEKIEPRNCEAVDMRAILR